MRAAVVVALLVALAPGRARADALADARAAFAAASSHHDQPEAALALGEKLLASVVRARGERSWDAAQVLEQLAQVKLWTRDRDGAVAYLRRAAHAVLAAPGIDDAELADVAMSLEQLGALSDAESLRRRALAVVDRPGAAPAMVAFRVDELATLLAASGKLDEALALRQRQVALIAANPYHGADDLAPALVKLADVQALHRDLADAEATARRALAVTDAPARARPGDVFRAQAAALLATIVSARGDDDEARARMQEALLVSEEAGGGLELWTGIAEAALSRGDLDDAAALAERARQLGHDGGEPAYEADVITAQVAIARGDRDTAEAALRRALAFSPTPQVLQTLASLYLDLGERARAESLILTAYARSSDAIAKRYSGALGVLRVAAQAAEANRDTAEAIRRYRQAFEVSEAFLRSVRLGVQEDRLLRILDQLAAEQDQVWSLVAAHPRDAAAVELGLEVALLRKGRGVDELAAAARAERATDPQFHKLVALRREYARLATGGAAGSSSRDQLEHDITALERTLRASGREPGELPGPSAIVGAVRAQLGPGEQLVEVVTYQPTRFADAAFHPAEPPHYLAFVLDARSVAAVDLGPAGAVDAQIEELRERIADGAHDHHYSDELIAAQRALYDATLGRLPLRNGGQVTLALDGQLQLVPFEVARDARGELVDRYTFRYVTSGRDLLPVHHGRGAGVRILADPAFSTTPLRFGDATLEAPARLPYTRSEADQIAKLFPGARVLEDTAATGDALLAGPAPRILHVATHGLFLDDLEPPPGAASRAVKLISATDPIAGPPPPNPMLRSALVLAHGGSEGDIVTAYRLADASLDGTELVVLSACETGLGERKRNQGVYGLRRALLIAGAQTVVTSLWSVNDEATRDLMVAYYRNLLAGRGRAAALHDAALAIRKRFPHPYYWAPFISIGSAAPLGR